MSNIKITTLGQIANAGNGTIYKDMHLDLTFGEPSGPSYYTTHATNDAVGDYDLGAIRNSLYNIFNTSAGEKILDPQFGASLQQFLFMPITNETGTLIGNTLRRNVQTYEPRVVVQNIDVYTDPDNNQYVIDFSIIIPALKNSSVRLTGTLSNSKKFIFN